MIARRALLGAYIAIAAGCASSPIEGIPQTVEIPIPVSCVTAEIPRPRFVTDRELAAADDYTLVLELAADRLKRQQYEAKLEAAIAGCR